MDKFDKKLVEAVKEYYKFQDGKNPVPVRFVEDKKGYRMLLVRFTDPYGKQLSALMSYQNWKDGHYDVTEMEFICTEYENAMVMDFEQSD